MPAPSLPFGLPRGGLKTLVGRLTRVQRYEPKITIGVDLGSTSIKVIALGSRKGPGLRPILGQNLVPLEAAHETDPSEPLRAALDTLHVPHRTVNLSVSGPWVLMRVVEMPPMKPQEMRQALPFEAQRYLPFNLQEVSIDGVTLGPAADAKKVWVLIVACKKELIERRLDWARRAGLEVRVIDVDALAAANGYLAAHNGQAAGESPRALINVGAQLTNLVIFRGQAPYLVRDIPWGGAKLVRQAAEQLAADEALITQELAQGSSRPELATAVKAACEGLVSELQLSFDYFENRLGQPPEEVLVSGGVSQSGVFLDGLKGLLTQAVHPWSPVQGLSGQFAVAYGLALRVT